MIIDRAKVLRYLGHTNQAIDANTEALLKQCIAEIKELAFKKFIYESYNIHKKNHSITLKDTILVMESKDIRAHLAYSDKCTLMAASLGLEVDRKIAYYSKTDMTKSLILDACASTAVEALCNEVEEIIRKEAYDQGYHITSRFSPGYGGLPITLQKPITQILQTYPKMGLTVSENSILLPRKSVTAIIGWQKEKPDAKMNQCQQCNKEDCLYRKADLNG